MIKHFGGERNRIHFAHLRNVLITGDSSFNEVAHLSEAGSLDFHAIVKAYLDYNFEGPYRPDHGRMIWGETGRPGYGLSGGFRYLQPDQRQIPGGYGAV